jgi:hypothetical protein
MQILDIEPSLLDKQHLYDIFMNHMNGKFQNFEKAFEFLLNINYYKKIAKHNNTTYDDKNLTNPLIIDNYVFIAHGCRSYGLYVGIKKDLYLRSFLH